MRTTNLPDTGRSSKDDPFGELQTGPGMILLAGLPLRLIAGFIENLRSNELLSESDAKRVLARLGIGRI